jgi:hypothetical protein
MVQVLLIDGLPDKEFMRVSISASKRFRRFSIKIIVQGISSRWS